MHENNNESFGAMGIVYIIIIYNHAVSDGFIISIGVVGIIMVMVFLINMVAIGCIKFRKYCTNIKFKLTKSTKK